MTQENSFKSLLQKSRLPENFIGGAGGIKLPTKPSYGKLSKQRFSRIHPGEEYKFPIYVVEDKESGEEYLATPDMAPHLGRMAQAKILRLAVDNAGTPKLIAEPIIDQSAKTTLWTTTMREAIERAENEWVRIESNMESQQYFVIVAAADLGEPNWPNQSMDKLIEAVFLGRVISHEDHPLIQQLQGRV
ncbi:hypothetical protein [Polynucleobacter sp. MWH-Aus1W21]|uniref:hypothetical protein n=1 Tax=Polynucleobacter sp. MWH-Aus1W21 TaxID=1855880 RepID=UPI001BFE91BF|nr:hypothetical protein [Polynucleobacter sp. MWH-Aus1W21]QWD67155.1 hypothetical protein ICW03_04970 [Polynucleobacter sp. MWH-Aus1W21]